MSDFVETFECFHGHSRRGITAWWSLEMLSLTMLASCFISVVSWLNKRCIFDFNMTRIIRTLPLVPSLSLSARFDLELENFYPLSAIISQWEWQETQRGIFVLGGKDNTTLYLSAVRTFCNFTSTIPRTPRGGSSAWAIACRAFPCAGTALWKKVQTLAEVKGKCWHIA